MITASYSYDWDDALTQAYKCTDRIEERVNYLRTYKNEDEDACKRYLPTFLFDSGGGRCMFYDDDCEAGERIYVENCMVDCMIAYAAIKDVYDDEIAKEAWKAWKAGRHDT
jgi:pantothenate kinase